MASGSVKEAKDEEVEAQFLVLKYWQNPTSGTCSGHMNADALLCDANVEFANTCLVLFRLV